MVIRIYTDVAKALKEKQKPRSRIVDSCSTTGAYWSNRYAYHFSNWHAKPIGRKPVLEVACWDELLANFKKQPELLAHKLDLILKVMSAELFSANPPWSFLPFPHSLRNFEKWCYLIDPSESEFTEYLQTCKRNMEDLEMKMKKKDFFALRYTEDIVAALSEHDIVFVAMPAGFGKTLAARYFMNKYFLKQSERLAEENKFYNKGAMDRSVMDMTKCLHLTPSATNAANAAHFLGNKLRNDQSVSALQHPMMDFHNRIDPSLIGVEYVFMPSREAETAIEIGRFGGVIIDEAHADDPSIACNFLRVLDAMSPEKAETDTAADVMPRRRIRKCLILSGIDSTDTRDMYKRYAEKHTHLSFTDLILPRTAAQWQEHRFTLHRNILHTVEDSLTASCEGRTILTRNIATKLRDAYGIRTREVMDNQDADLTTGFNKMPGFMVERIVASLLEVQSAYIAGAVRDRDRKSGPRNDYERLQRRLQAGETVDRATIDRITQKANDVGVDQPFEFPNIVIFVPSTGAAQQVLRSVRGRVTNRHHPIAHDYRYVQPYEYEVCSQTLQVEECLTTMAARKYPKWIGTSRYWNSPKLPNFCLDVSKGRVLIVVNGAERGLTIPNVGVVIESGLERVRTPHSRIGLNNFSFLMSDAQCVQQRAGRGGRTRPSEYVLCLGVSGLRALEARGETVLKMKRDGNRTMLDYLRIMRHLKELGEQITNNSVWIESVVEGRVNGTLVNPHSEASSQPDKVVYDMVVARSLGSHLAAKSIPNMEPTHVRQLHAYLCAGMGMHGVIRIALLMCNFTALAKPSKSSRASIVGPYAAYNTLDIFSDFVCTTVHEGPFEGELRIVHDYEGDLCPLLEFHLQLIKAAKWDMESPVPSRDELLNSTPHTNNFFSGDHLPHGPVRWTTGLRERMDNTKLDTPEVGINFVYGRLVADEERQQLWSLIQMIALDLLHRGFIKSISELRSPSLNKYVHNIDTDPILSMRGRALLSAIDTIFSTRFAVPTSKPPLRGEDNVMLRKKSRGVVKEYFMRFDTPDEKSRRAILTDELTHHIRSESKWNLPLEKCWIRYDPSDVSISGKPEGKQEAVAEMPNVWEQEPPERIYITVADPVTDAQAALFANSAGRWRVVAEEDEDKKEVAILEIELNGRAAYFGMKLAGKREQVAKIGYFRHWILKNLPYSRYRKDEGKDYEIAINQLIDVWIAAGPMKSRPKIRIHPYFE